MAAAPTVTCSTHRRRPRVATCGTCSNALCADCVVRTGVGVKCRNCTGVKAAGARSGPERSGGTAARRRPWAAALVAGGVAVLGVAAYGLATRDSGTVATEAFQGIPAEFTERQSEFVGAGGQRIGGTLTLPGAGVGQNVPAVLIIPGLGALDRNTVAAADPPDALRDALVATVGGVALSSGDPMYRDLGESLARAGIASFRYDRRGTTSLPLADGQRLSFDDEVADARAALELLANRAEIGGAPLAVLGHDTGAVVAMRVSAGNNRVKALVAISTPGRPFVEAVAADLARSRGDAAGDGFRAAAAALASTGKSPAADTLPDIIRPVFAPGHDAYLATILAINPVTEVGNVAAPVLLIRSAGDPSLSAADTDRMSSSLRTGGQVMVGSSDANRNLAMASAGHEHSNSPVAQETRRDVEIAAGLTAWLQLNLSS